MKDVTIVVGLGFGDEGKGTMVDFLAREAEDPAVVRFNGGPQAAHNVINSDGTWHCFAQLGSGTFNPKAKTHISKQMLIKISDLQNEASSLREKGIVDSLERLTIDPNCHLVMPFHAMVGQLLEASRGSGCYGTVGMGVGEAVHDWQLKGDGALIAKDLLDEKIFRSKVRILWDEKTEFGLQLIEQSKSAEVFEVYQSFVDFLDIEEMIDRHLQFIQAHDRCLVSDQEFFDSQNGSVILEGSQGALIDRDYGFFPHITKTCTRVPGALELLKNNHIETKPTKLGVIRGYSTRHGHGPFPTQDETLCEILPDIHNQESRWQGRFRVGWFDLIMTRYALEISEGIDYLAITNLDRLSILDNIQVCAAYDYLGEDSGELDEFFEWERCNGEAIITKIKVLSHPNQSHQSRLTEHLKKCRPIHPMSFAGWNGQTVTESKLPKQMIRYLDFLQSNKGLGIPIGIISIGPTANDKIYLHRF